MSSVNIPAPPLSTDNILQYCKDLHTYMSQTQVNGHLIPSMKASEIVGITKKQHIGTVVYESDTNKLSMIKDVGGVPTKVEITTT